MPNKEFIYQQFHYKKSRIQQLKGFCYTVQEGSARKASEKMGLGASAIAMQIKALERDLKIKLFTRTANHRLKITPAGQKFYEMAIIQLNGIDSLFENFHRTMKSESENNLDIAVHTIVGTFILPKYIKQLLDQKEFKHLKIKIHNIPRVDSYKKLISKEIDLVFYPYSESRTVPIELEKKDVFEYKISLVMHKNHPLAKKERIEKQDLEKYPYMTRDPYASFFNDIRRYLDCKTENIAFENATQEMTIGFVVQNINMTIIAEKLIENQSWKVNSNLIYKDITHLMAKTSYSLFYLKNSTPKKCVEFLINRILEDKDIR